MRNIYDMNNLPFWNEEEIEVRAQLAESFQQAIRRLFQSRNRAWVFERIEAPMMIPRELLSAEYEDEKMFVLPVNFVSLRQELMEDSRHWSHQETEALCPEEDDWRVLREMRDLDPESRWPDKAQALLERWAKRKSKWPKQMVLRPETTPASYAWMRAKLTEKKSALPYCVWQLNKSFRREQDQPSKHMRLKEFWQQEFQCAYSSDTMDDYQAFCLLPVKELIADLTRCPARIVKSERLPNYSVATFDVEVWNSQKWMEICSISKRIDFPADVALPMKANQAARQIIVCEIATSPDRQFYCRALWREAWKTLKEEEAMDQWDESDLVSNETAAWAKKERDKRA